MNSPYPLALPAPTLERHLARTIDGSSLTGVPGAWSAPIKRRRSGRPAQAAKPVAPWTITIHPAFVTSRRTRLYFVTSQWALPDGSTATMQSVNIADNQAQAQARQLHKANARRDARLAMASLTTIQAWAPGRRLT